MQNNIHKLSKATVALHWVVGIPIIILIIVGIYIDKTNANHLIPLHKSIGTIMFIVILIRIVVRMKEGWPQPVSTYAKWEQLLAKIVHWILIIGTVMFPISGMMMSSMGGHGLSIFGLDLLPANLVNDRLTPINTDLAKTARQIHGALAPTMIIAIILHIAGAYKHHIIDKDSTMLRILGRTTK